MNMKRTKVIPNWANFYAPFEINTRKYTGLWITPTYFVRLMSDPIKLPLDELQQTMNTKRTKVIPNWADFHASFEINTRKYYTGQWRTPTYFVLELGIKT